MIGYRPLGFGREPQRVYGSKQERARLEKRRKREKNYRRGVLPSGRPVTAMTPKQAAVNGWHPHDCTCYDCLWRGYAKRLPAPGGTTCGGEEAHRRGP